MPLYAYRCTSCCNKFEKIQNFSAEPETICPNCGKATLIRPLTAPRLNFKGAGWYVNDYASKSSESSESSSESKPGESKEASSKEASASGDKPSAPAATPAAPSTPAPAPKSSTDS